MPKRPLIIARQAGSISNLIVVVDYIIKLNKRPPLVLCFPPAYDFLVRLHKKKNYIFLINSFYEAVEYIDNEKFNFLLTGTSLSSTDDSLFWQWANLNNILSMAYIDSWHNYEKRFLSVKKENMPTYIGVVDKIMKNDVNKLKLPVKKVKVLGIPSANSIIDYYKSNKNKKTINKKIILFISEPTINDFEFKLYKILSKLLQKIAKEINIEYVIKIKPHPLENFANWYEFANNKYVRLTPNEEITKLIAESDIVIGISSSCLYYSRLINQRAIAYLPNKEFKTLPHKDIKKVLSPSTLYKELKKDLINDYKIKVNFTYKQQLQSNLDKFVYMIYEKNTI